MSIAVSGLWHNITGAVVLAAFMLAVLIPFELIAARTRYTLGSRRLGVTLNVLGAVLGAALSYGLILVWHRFIAGPVVKVPLESILSPLGLLAVPAAVVILTAFTDFLRYWRHRLEHRLFWPIHLVHHSATDLHAANNLGHPLQAFPEFLLVIAPLALFSFEGPAVPIAVSALITLSNGFIHSPTRFHLGALRRVFVDNRFHRIHHSLEPRHFGKNYGIVLTVWDQLFGTAYFPQPSEWPDTGVAGVRPPRSILDYLVFPFGRTATGDRLAPIRLEVLREDAKQRIAA